MDMYLKFQGGTFSLCRRFNSRDRYYAKRKSVSIFTVASRRRMLKYLRSCVSKYWCLGTLTYPGDFDARDFRQHWRVFVERWRRVYGSDSANSLFWFVEFQGNGQPHFHFYSNHFIEKGWLSNAWASAVGSGNAKHFRSGTRIETLRGRDAAARYAAKYAAKQEQKELPVMFANSSGRWWGIVGNRDIVAASITVTDTEYNAFELFDIVKIVENTRSKVIFDDSGAKVWFIRDKSCYARIFRGLRRANKVLLQAETQRAASIYRERRGESNLLCVT